MKEFITLFKAIITQDTRLFRDIAGKNASPLFQRFCSCFLALCLMGGMGIYNYMFATKFAEEGYTSLILILFGLLTLMGTLMEGAHKAQGMLFDGKDNDLLFSLPISKSKIFSARILKYLGFQFIFSTLFFLPSIIVYAMFEKPSISYYFISLLTLFLLPMLPSVIAAIGGYVVKAISTKFSNKKTIETILSLIFIGGLIFAGRFYMNVSETAIDKTAVLVDLLSGVYYPLDCYIRLITNFNIIDSLGLILINIIPLIIFIYIGSIFYFKIISKTNEHSEVKLKYNPDKIKYHGQMYALITKELKRFLSSPVYVLNNIFGPILLIIMSIGLSINAEEVILGFTKDNQLGITPDIIIEILPQIYIQMLMFVSLMSGITSSSISLEGKSFNITKSLPVNTNKILLSKVIMSDIVIISLLSISNIIFFIGCNVNFTDIILISLFSITVPTLSAAMGVAINLKWPKMIWYSETEVVKQSFCTMISTFWEMLTMMFSIFFWILFINNPTFLWIELLIYLLLDILALKLMFICGKRYFNKINV